MSNINSNTLGKYFRRNGRIYRHVSYCEHPTATLKSVSGPDAQEVGGAIGSLNLSGFEPLTESECKLLDELFDSNVLNGKNFERT